MKALDLDPSILHLVKFDPNQPRVPAGNGEESGRWVDDTRSAGSFLPSSRPRRIRTAANGPLTPEGIETVPSPPVDPLDPLNLNKNPPSSEEQQAIADALNIIITGTSDEVKNLQPHRYQNLPEKLSGAVLPLDAEGYFAYNLSADRIEGWQE